MVNPRYRNKNYVVVDGVTPFDVLVSDLPKNSNHKIDCQCDNCDNTANISLFHYNKNFETYFISAIGVAFLFTTLTITGMYNSRDVIVFLLGALLFFEKKTKNATN